MKNVFYWIKSNLITVLSIVIALAAIIFIFNIYSKGSKLSSNIESQGNSLSDIRNYMNQDVQIPSAAPGKQSRRIRNVVINQKAIDSLKKKYKKANENYKK